MLFLLLVKDTGQVKDNDRLSKAEIETSIKGKKKLKLILRNFEISWVTSRPILHK